MDLENDLFLYVTATEHFSDALIITDFRYIITQVNRAATIIFGYKRDELVNSHIRLISGDETTTDIHRRIPHAVKTEKIWKGKSSGMRNDGVEFPVHLTVVPVQANSGPKRYLLLIHDLSGKDAACRLTDTFRRDYHHILGHELNNLLTPLVGMAQLLRESLEASGTPTLAEKAHAMYEIARKMASFVEKLRQVNSIELGMHPLTLRRGDISRVTASIIGDLMPLAQEDGIQLCYNRHRDACIADFDFDLMPRVIENLLRNAMEHVRSEGNARDKVVTVTTSMENAIVTLSIHNYGDPVCPEDLSRFFEPFFTTRNKIASGTGLGTFYARLVVEAHGGTISVSSDAEHGTLVRFDIPAHSVPVN